MFNHGIKSTSGPLLLIFLLALGGCKSQSIRQDAHARWYDITAKPASVAAIQVHDGPFQLALTLTEGSLAQLLHEALAAEINLPAEKAHALFNAAPHITLEKTDAKLGDCPTCLTIDTDVRMGLKAVGQTPELAASALAQELKTHIQLDCKLHVEATPSGPQLVIEDLALRTLKTQGLYESGFSNPTSPMGKMLNQKLNQMLFSPKPIHIALPSQLKLGAEPLPLTATGYRLEKGAPGQLIIGFSTSALASGNLELKPHGDPILEDGQWALSISSALLHHQISRDLAQNAGLSVTEFLDLRAMQLDGNDIGMTLRLWHTQGRPWWKALAVNAEVSVLDGGVQIQPRGISTGKGAGWHFRAKKSPNLERCGELTANAIENLAEEALAWPHYTDGQNQADLKAIYLNDDQAHLIGELHKPR